MHLEGKRTLMTAARNQLKAQCRAHTTSRKISTMELTLSRSSSSILIEAPVVSHIKRQALVSALR